MDEDHRHHKVAADNVYQTKKPAIGNLVHNELDALKGILLIGNVIEDQQDAGADLDQEGGKGHHPQGAKNADIIWDPVLGELGADQFFETDPDLQPISDFLDHFKPQ